MLCLLNNAQIDEEMFLMGNITANNTKVEAKETGCVPLDTFFNNADKDLITLTDSIVCVVNGVFSVVATVFNLVVLYALCKASSLHSTSKALLFSLALSDLGVGVIVQPLFVAYRWAQIDGILPDFCTVGIVSHIEGSHFSAVSFLTITAISMDRLLALVLRLQYHSVVTFRRVLVTLVGIWTLGAVWASSWTRNQERYSLTSIIYMPICFAVTFFAYLKIYFALRKRALAIRRQVGPTRSKNAANNRSLSRFEKSVSSMFYLFCAFVVSFLPYLCHKIAVNFLGWRTSTSILFSFDLTLVYLNSSLNPLIYCWRITEIKQIVSRILCRTQSRLVVRQIRFLPSQKNA